MAIKRSDNAKNVDKVEKPMGKLTIQQENFCQAYVELLGNGTKAAIAAFDIDDSRGRKAQESTASSMANEYLRKPEILKRVRELLDLIGMNDETVDAEVNFCLRQSEDLGAKLRAADMYNKMAGRYEKDNKQKQVSVIIKKFGEE